MLLKVTVKEGHDFLPQIKTGGKFWRAPKTLHAGESIEVQDDIGYRLLADEAFAGCFEVLKDDPIADSVDNSVTREDVLVKKDKPRRATRKDVQTRQLTHGEIALQTAAEYSPIAAEKIANMVQPEEGDKNGLKKEALSKLGDGHDKVSAPVDAAAIAAGVAAAQAQAAAKPAAAAPKAEAHK